MPPTVPNKSPLQALKGLDHPPGEHFPIWHFDNALWPLSKDPIFPEPPDSVLEGFADANVDRLAKAGTPPGNVDYLDAEAFDFLHYRRHHMTPVQVKKNKWDDTFRHL